MAKARTPLPRIRRQGFTPRTISSPAQTIRATAATTLTIVPAVPDRWKIHRTATATTNTMSGALGSWATVISPVWRLRNNQSIIAPSPWRHDRRPLGRLWAVADRHFVDSDPSHR